MQISNKKFILQESFILNEDVNDDLISAIETLRRLISTNGWLNELNQLKNELNGKDNLELYNKLRTYRNATLAVLEKANKNVNTNDLLKELDNLISQVVDNKISLSSAKSEAQNICELLLKRLNDLLTDPNSENVKILGLLDQLNVLISNSSEAQNTKLASLYIDINRWVWQTYDELKKVKNLSQNAEKLKEIKNDLEKYIYKIELSNDEDKFSTKGSKSVTRDWAKELKDAASEPTKANAIWEEYFDTEWGENKKNIKRLGEAFYVEVNALGFSQKTNPFISYIRKLFELKIYPDANHYANVHNLYNEKVISNLQILGKNALQYNDLVFNKNFYSISLSDMQKYCEYLNEVTDKFVKNYDQFFTNKVLANKYPRNSLAQFLTDFFYGETSIFSENFKSVIPTNILNESNLKSLTFISEDALELFGSGWNDIPEKQDFKIDAIKNKITSKAQAINLIKYLLATEVNDRNEIQNTLNRFAISDSSLSILDILKCKSVLSSFTITPSNVNKIIEAIADFANL